MNESFLQNNNNLKKDVNGFFSTPGDDYFWVRKLNVNKSPERNPVSFLAQFNMSHAIYIRYHFKIKTATIQNVNNIKKGYFHLFSFLNCKVFCKLTDIENAWLQLFIKNS